MQHICASHELSDAQLGKVGEACATTLSWPLQAREGATLGTLYLLNAQPRELDAEEREALQDFANLAHDLLVREADEARQRQEIAALQASERRMALAIAGSGTGIWDRNIATGEIHYSSSWKALLGLSLIHI